MKSASNLILIHKSSVQLNYLHKLIAVRLILMQKTYYKPLTKFQLTILGSRHETETILVTTLPTSPTGLHADQSKHQTGL